MFRILLVDDEAQEREGIRFLIEKYRLPLSVVEAQNGQKALEYLKGHPVDILFTGGTRFVGVDTRNDDETVRGLLLNLD